MTRRILAAFLLAAVVAGCDKPTAPEKTDPGPAAKSPEPAGPEPSRITVQHVLIAFQGATRAPQHVTRSKDEAAEFAKQILERVRKGEDITVLAKQHSTDPGGGRYTLVNNGVAHNPPEIPRRQFIKPFTDVAFKLKVGEAGIAEYHPQNCPYGWHVIKRLE